MEIALYIFLAVLLANLVISLLVMCALGLFDEARQENHATQPTHREKGYAHDYTKEDSNEDSNEDSYPQLYAQRKSEIARSKPYSTNMYGL